MVLRLGFALVVSDLCVAPTNHVRILSWAYLLFEILYPLGLSIKNETSLLFIITATVSAWLSNEQKLGNV